jgi:hypothetical protein
MSKRTRIVPEGPAKIIKDEAAGTVLGALNTLMAVSKRDDFDLSTLSYMYREDCPNAALQVAVDRLRDRGFTWEEIAKATGMARSSAYQRWNGRRPL